MQSGGLQAMQEGDLVRMWKACAASDGERAGGSPLHLR